MSNGPILLGLDASTGRCSVALMHDGSVIERASSEGLGHSAILLTLTEAVLAEAGLSRGALDAIVCTRGPGAFTGVRITVGVAQGLAMGLDLPVVVLSSLQVVAETALSRQEAGSQDGFLVLQDARMQEVYGGFYRLGSGVPATTQLVGEEWVGPAQLPALPAGRWAGVGSAFAEHPDLQSASGLVSVDQGVTPSMAAAMPLAARRFADNDRSQPQYIEPTYLRNRVADIPRG